MTKGKSKILVFILAMLVLAVAVVPVVKAVPVPVDYTRETGSLKITKYEQPDGNKTPEGRKPLAGVKFEIYKVDDDTTDTSTIPTKYTDPSTASSPESKDFVKRESTTQTEGTVKFDSLPIGRYLVHEAEAPVNVVQKIPNFLIDIPQTSADGKTVEYDVEVAPKNETVYGSFILNKQDHDGAQVNGAKFKLQKQQDGQPTVWADYPDAGQAVHTVAEGKIELTGLPLGTYRLIETEVASTGYILDNKTAYQFVVTRDAQSNATKVEPEELTAINDKPTVTKKLVTAEGASDNSVNDGDELTYQLKVDIPTSIENLKTFKVIDKISDTQAIVYKKGSVEIKALRASDSGEEELSEVTHYTVNEDVSGAAFEVEFKPDQLAAYKGKTLTITYKVTFNAIPDHNDLTNTADVTYSNAVKDDVDGNPNTDKGADETTTNGGSEGSGGGESGGGPATPDPDGKVEIHTGGIKILKRADNDVSGEKLGGAKFKLAKTESEAKNGTYLKKKGGTDDIELVTSSEDDDTKGIAQYYGLAYGDYYLVEVEAPVKDGKAYNMLTKPQLIHVDANSYTTDKVIVNRSGTTLPETGGMTTIGFTVVGIVFIIVAIVMFTKKDKKDKKDEKSSK